MVNMFQTFKSFIKKKFGILVSVLLFFSTNNFSQTNFSDSLFNKFSSIQLVVPSMATTIEKITYSENKRYACFESIPCHELWDLEYRRLMNNKIYDSIIEHVDLVSNTGRYLGADGFGVFDIIRNTRVEFQNLLQNFISVGFKDSLSLDEIVYNIYAFSPNDEYVILQPYSDVIKTPLFVYKMDGTFISSIEFKGKSFVAVSFRRDTTGATVISKNCEPLGSKFYIEYFNTGKKSTLIDSFLQMPSHPIPNAHKWDDGLYNDIKAENDFFIHGRRCKSELWEITLLDLRNVKNKIKFNIKISATKGKRCDIDFASINPERSAVFVSALNGEHYIYYIESRNLKKTNSLFSNPNFLSNFYLFGLEYWGEYLNWDREKLCWYNITSRKKEYCDFLIRKLYFDWTMMGDPFCWPDSNAIRKEYPDGVIKIPRTFQKTSFNKLNSYTYHFKLLKPGEVRFNSTKPYTNSSYQYFGIFDFNLGNLKLYKNLIYEDLSFEPVYIPLNYSDYLLGECEYKWDKWHNKGDSVLLGLGSTFAKSNIIRSEIFWSNNNDKFCFKNDDGTMIFLNKSKIKNYEQRVYFSMFNDYSWILYSEDKYYARNSTNLNSQSLQFYLDGKVYPFEQFDLKYNRPDIILDRLGYADSSIIVAYHNAYLKRLKKMNFTEDMLKEDLHIPDIKIKNFEKIPPTTDSTELNFEFEYNDTKYKLDRINIWLNDVPIFGASGINLRSENTNSGTKSIRIPLAIGQNKLQVSILNQVGIESYKQTINIVHKIKTKVKPNLYLITIGVSNYINSLYNLTYASKDADDIKSTLSKKNKIYANVFSYTYTNEKVTKENILALKKELLKAKRDDVVIITVAGHGVLDKNLDYYLATYDMDFNNPSGKGIPYEELESLVDGIAPLKKVIFLDACHSGEVDKEEVEQLAVNTTGSGDVKFRAAGAGIKKKNLGLKTTSELMGELFTDLRRGTGATVISSAGGAEYAMESDQWKNGLFTYCLLHGLKDKAADANKDGQIMLSELQQYLRTEVTTLSNGAQQPTSRIENLTMDFRVW